jgi:biotin carboxyl carrier protein
LHRAAHPLRRLRTTPFERSRKASGDKTERGCGAEDLDGGEISRAPYLGTFYRAPKPGEASFVELGATVGAESELCLVEVMKLFTSVRAGIAGTIAHVLAVDGQMVEAGQPLFAIEPRG